jgi:hypothetical protein
VNLTFQGFAGFLGLGFELKPVFQGFGRFLGLGFELNFCKVLRVRV